MKYPIGIQNFGEVRNGGYVYVDKTPLIYKMISEGKYYFLSRPRRFGKSLLLSTIEAYFEGRKSLFDGLAMSRLETEWKDYPILHLDLNTEKYETPEALNRKLNQSLSKWEERYGTESYEVSLSARFEGIIKRASEQAGCNVVILIDEYDKPLLQAIGNEALQADYRSTLKAFYGALKSCDRYIKFAFLTGVTKFGKVSVFSDLNNLKDISFDRRYIELCGITEKELHRDFDDSVRELADANGLTKEECYEKLKEDYDGYQFEEGTVGMYNPFSVLNTLDSCQFRDYWFETGTPSFLVQQLQKTDFPLDMMTEMDLTADVLNSIDVMDENPLPLLYQSGYLTIKNYDSEFKVYQLGFPNREVKEGFIRYLVPFYLGKNKMKAPFDIRSFVKEVRNGEPEAFMERLVSLFANGDYQLMGDKEIYFQNVMYLLFMLLGFYVQVERHTTNGRMDILVQTADFVYIFELKINQSADVALKQIEDKGYARPFEMDSRKLYKIGVNFSTETRMIDDWKTVC